MSAIKLERRIEIARAIVEQGMGTTEVSERYSVSKSTACRFARAYRAGKLSGPSRAGAKPPPIEDGRAYPAFTKPGRFCEQCYGYSENRPEDGSSCACGGVWAREVIARPDPWDRGASPLGRAQRDSIGSMNSLECRVRLRDKLVAKASWGSFVGGRSRKDPSRPEVLHLGKHVDKKVG